jgi:hypothetical protein
MHIEIFNIAKNKLDNNENVVIGGFLVPSSDDYVYGKLGKEAISLKHRNKMIEIATSSSDFISYFPFGYVSGGIINLNSCRRSRK